MLYIVIAVYHVSLMTIFNDIYITGKEFKKQFDVIMKEINNGTESVWIIDYNVALIPANLYKELIAVIPETCQNSKPVLSVLSSEQ